MALDVDTSIEDIEDFYIDTEQPRSARAHRPRPGNVEARLREPEESERRNVPGAQSIWVKTFGCSHNHSDSEYMMGVLEAYGYRCASDSAGL
jgi:threonylcarbamoyladenosine tRNA methylthiotransferase CDKAL1